MTRPAMLILLSLLALTWLTTGSVLAHAEFDSATPAPDSTVTTPPSEVVIVFTEELEPTGNQIRVTDASGVVVDQGDTEVNTGDPQRATIRVSLTSGLANGVYTVTWTNAGADGHSEEGSYSFTVGAAPTTTAAPTAGLPATGASERMTLGLWLLAALLAGAAGFTLRRAAPRRG